MLNDLERKQLETNRGLLGNALAEQAYMKIIMQGLKKLFDESGRADITEHNMNASTLIDAYEKVLKENDMERAKEE